MVELDQIFSAFDPKTRAAFETWMQQGGIALTNRGEDFNQAFAQSNTLNEEKKKNRRAQGAGRGLRSGARERRRDRDPVSPAGSAVKSTSAGGY